MTSTTETEFDVFERFLTRKIYSDADHALERRNLKRVRSFRDSYKEDRDAAVSEVERIERDFNEKRKILDDRLKSIELPKDEDVGRTSTILKEIVDDLERNARDLRMARAETSSKRLKFDMLTEELYVAEESFEKAEIVKRKRRLLCQKYADLLYPDDLFYRRDVVDGVEVRLREARNEDYVAVKRQFVVVGDASVVEVEIGDSSEKNEKGGRYLAMREIDGKTYPIFSFALEDGVDENKRVFDEYDIVDALTLFRVDGESKKNGGAAMVVVEFGDLDASSVEGEENDEVVDGETGRSEVVVDIDRDDISEKIVFVAPVGEEDRPEFSEVKTVKEYRGGEHFSSVAKSLRERVFVRFGGDRFVRFCEPRSVIRKNWTQKNEETFETQTRAVEGLRSVSVVDVVDDCERFGEDVVIREDSGNRYSFEYADKRNLPPPPSKYPYGLSPNVRVKPMFVFAGKSTSEAGSLEFVKNTFGVYPERLKSAIANKLTIEIKKEKARESGLERRSVRVVYKLPTSRVDLTTMKTEHFRDQLQAADGSGVSVAVVVDSYENSRVVSGKDAAYRFFCYEYVGENCAHSAWTGIPVYAVDATNKALVERFDSKTELAARFNFTVYALTFHLAEGVVYDDAISGKRYYFLEERAVYRKSDDGTSTPFNSQRSAADAIGNTVWEIQKACENKSKIDVGAITYSFSFNPNDEDEEDEDDDDEDDDDEYDEDEDEDDDEDDEDEDDEEETEDEEEDDEDEEETEDEEEDDDLVVKKNIVENGGGTRFASIGRRRPPKFPKKEEIVDRFLKKYPRLAKQDPKFVRRYPVQSENGAYRVTFFVRSKDNTNAVRCPRDHDDGVGMYFHLNLDDFDGYFACAHPNCKGKKALFRKSYEEYVST